MELDERISLCLLYEDMKKHKELVKELGLREVKPFEQTNVEEKRECTKEVKSVWK